MCRIVKRMRALERRLTRLAPRRPHHRPRHAEVYLRQSTPGQVDTQRESPARQYTLADRAVALGWDRGQVVLRAQDRGTSGTTPQGRGDCPRLMVAVGLGEGGAVFAREASRFSRAQAAWHRRRDLCALTDPLVVEHDGVDDPTACNDRVLLGGKGTWRHTDRHALRLRLQGAKLHKAHTGERPGTPPTGDINDAAGALVLDPAARVVAALPLLCAQCNTLGSASGGWRFFADHRRPCPRRLWAPGTNGRRHWGPLSLSRLLAILHTPTSTGADVDGRRRRHPVVVAGPVVRPRTRPRPQA
jgi:DNA invertase Pin-like site-specific DNA recombinase